MEATTSAPLLSSTDTGFATALTFDDVLLVPAASDVLPRMTDVLLEGFDRLAPFIALAHAKDVVYPADGGSHCQYVPAGKGLLDYKTYLAHLSDSGYSNGLIMHSLAESDIADAVMMIRAAEAHSGIVRRT